MSIEEILEAMDIELDKSKNVPLTRGKSPVSYTHLTLPTILLV